MEGVGHNPHEYQLYPHLPSLVVKMEGVGKADIHVDCDRLRASMEGVGSVTLSGQARQADISKGGIGGVNTRNLKIGE